MIEVKFVCCTARDARWKVPLYDQIPVRIFLVHPDLLGRLGAGLCLLRSSMEPAVLGRTSRRVSSGWRPVSDSASRPFRLIVALVNQRCTAILKTITIRSIRPNRHKNHRMIPTEAVFWYPKRD